MGVIKPELRSRERVVLEEGFGNEGLCNKSNGSQKPFARRI
jgi:hypothetical protein